jgi:polyadenylate-binding protein
LPENIDSYLLRKAFKEYGEIEFCKVATSLNGASKGYGFVQFTQRECCFKAVQALDRAKFNGTTVYIREYF